LQEPLRTVVTFAQLLAQNTHGHLDAEAHECLGYILAAATRMHALVNDLLRYARVVNADDLPLTAIALHEAVEGAVTNLQLAIQESQAVIDMEPLPTLRGERGQLIQLFQNLLSNAIKYRGQDPPVIRIRAERHAAAWVISVVDNGVGVPPEYQDYIFGVFKRLHGADYPGTGVGLALCKHIVETLGGRIWVESVPGQGATFKVSLPA
jgi:light-regulated signal transduction histidine kinase (bacteriophytochrome)